MMPDSRHHAGAVAHPRARLDAELSEAVASLARHIAALPETSMRISGLVQQVQSIRLERATELLDGIIRGTLDKHADCAAAYAALLVPEPMQHALGAGRCGMMLRWAEQRRLVAVRTWLLAPNVAGADRAEDAHRLIAQELQHLTLGERRSRARRAGPAELDRFLVDPDPGVIANLLNNPRITESMVLRICSRRPTVSDALEAVFAAPRWGSRHAVRRALVRNPYFNQTYALTLLPTLTRHELAELSTDETLDETRRYAAATLRALPPSGL